MSKRKKLTQPAVQFFPSQSANLQKPAKRTADGDIVNDPSGVTDKSWEDVTFGEKLVERIDAVLPMSVPNQVPHNGIHQWIMQFPYSNVSVQYLKQARKAGIKDIKVVLPKIHRVECRVQHAGQLFETYDDDGNTVKREISGIVALANDTDMRKWPQLKFPANLGTNKTRRLPSALNSAAIEEIDLPMPLIEHVWKPMYAKNFSTGVKIQLFQNQATGAAPVKTQGVARPNIDVDLTHERPFTNMKQLPMQFWEPHLYLGLWTEKIFPAGLQVKFDVEFSYEEVDGVDYSYREQGLISGELVSTLYNEEPSKVFFVKTIEDRTPNPVEYHNNVIIRCSKLNVFDSPNVKNVKKVTDANQLTQPQISDLLLSDQNLKVPDAQVTAQSAGGYTPYWTFNPYAIS